MKKFCVLLTIGVLFAMLSCSESPTGSNENDISVSISKDASCLPQENDKLANITITNGLAETIKLRSMEIELSGNNTPFEGTRLSSLIMKDNNNLLISSAGSIAPNPNGEDAIMKFVPGPYMVISGNKNKQVCLYANTSGIKEGNPGSETTLIIKITRAEITFIESNLLKTLDFIKPPTITLRY